MTATTASDPSGVQYYFDCTAGAGGHDSAWQSSATYQDTGLSPSTQYTYRVQTRDQSTNQNTGGWSTTQSATTTQAGGGTSHTVFDGGFQNSWAAGSSVTVTSFGGYTVMNISGSRLVMAQRDKAFTAVTCRRRTISNTRYTSDSRLGRRPGRMAHHCS